MLWTRRFALFLMLVLFGRVGADGKFDQENFVDIPRALNFQSDSVEQRITGRIILLYVSAPDCVYCKKLEKEIIFPLLRSGDYADKIILRKIEWHGSRSLTDFAGESTKEQDFLIPYDIKATPTLLFLGADGVELHQPLLGYRGGQFYWYYFDAAIKQSNLNLQTSKSHKPNKTL